jgi:hypothetical protein
MVALGLAVGVRASFVGTYMSLRLQQERSRCLHGPHATPRHSTAQHDECGIDVLVCFVSFLFIFFFRRGGGSRLFPRLRLRLLAALGWFAS